MSLGKVNSSPKYISYIRQQGTSSYLGYKDDLVDQIINSSLGKDFNNMVPTIAKEIEKNESPNSYTEIIYQIYQAYLGEIKVQLANRVLRYRFKKLFRIKLKYLELSNVFKAIASKFLLKKSTSNYNILLKKLSQEGASSQQLISQRNELQNISNVIEGNECNQFIRVHSQFLTKENKSERK